MFGIFTTDTANRQLENLKTDKGLSKRYKAVKRVIQILSEDPRYPGLQTHQYTSLKGPKGEKVFESYADQSTPAAYRVFYLPYSNGQFPQKYNKELPVSC